MSRNSDDFGKDTPSDKGQAGKLTLSWTLDREARALFHEIMQRRFGKLYEDGRPSRDLTFDEAADRYLASITAALEDDLNSYKQSTAASRAIEACERIEIAGARI